MRRMHDAEPEREPDLVTQLELSVRLEELHKIALECLCSEIDRLDGLCVMCVARNQPAVSRHLWLTHIFKG